MTTRYIELDNKELEELVIKKGELVAEGKELMKPLKPDFEKIDKINKKLNKLMEEKQEIEEELREKMIPANEKGQELQDLKSKIVPMVEEAIKGKELGEYETYTSTEIKDGKLVVSIVDELELFKEKFQKK